MEIKRAAAVFLLAAVALAARSRPAPVEFQPIRALASGTLGRACTIGFANLKAYFDKRGVAFAPKLVTSHKLTYCHIYFEPSHPGFRAFAEYDPIGPAPAGSGVLSTKLPWLAHDMEVVRNPRFPARLLLLYGDQSRKTLGRAVRDEEYDYLLRVEFGVDQATHVPATAIPLREAVVLGPGNVAHVSATAGKASALLAGLGFQIEPLLRK